MSRIYTHNGSANIPHIFAVDVITGDSVGKWTITDPGEIRNPQAISLDWKSKIVYLADIGDPQNNRTDIALWGVPESALVASDPVLAGTAYPISYSFGPRDAKALAINPKTGDKYIITYESVGRLVKLPNVLTGNNPGSNLNKAMPAFVTDACFSIDGKWLFIRADGVANTLVYNATTWVYDGVVTSEVATGDSITAEADGKCLLLAGRGKFAPVFRVCLPAKYALGGSTPGGGTGGGGTVKDPTPGLVTRADTNAIREASGMAYSKKHSKMVWINNDEIEKPQVYGISLDNGSTKGTFSVNLPDDGDPECIRVHPITGAIWFGDIGDNNNEDGDHPGDSSHRTDIGIWVLSEPNLGNQGTLSATKYGLKYPSGAKYNAEALMIHPISGAAYIITKANPNGSLYKIKTNANHLPSDNDLTKVNGSMPKLVSDATFTTDGKWALIRCKNVDNTIVYNTSNWTKVGEIANPTGMNSVLEQCESITMETAVSFLLGSETKDSGKDSPIVRVLLPGKYRPAGSGGDDGGGDNTDCDATETKPADVLNLSNWKVTLPTPIGSTGDPDEVTQPQLDSYEKASYFYTSCPGPVVVFNAPVNGATTSNSGYPRSELREMKSSGTQEIAWNSGSGTHTLECNLAFTHLPGGKPHVVGMQIHGDDDDFTVLRLEGSTLYATKGEDTHNKTLMTGYTLGTYITVKMVASSAGVKYYINGVLKGTVSGTQTGCYFKTGCYTQANDSGESGKTGTGYGEVRIKSVKVTHS